MNAKNNVLVRWNGYPHHISFNISRKDQCATVKYYKNYNFVETVQCDVSGADDRWKQAIESGYEVAF